MWEIWYCNNLREAREYTTRAVLRKATQLRISCGSENSHGTRYLSAFSITIRSSQGLQNKVIRQFIMLSVIWNYNCFLSLYTFFLSPFLRPPPHHFLTLLYFSALSLSPTQRAFRNLYWKSDLYTLKANCSVPGALWRKSIIELQKEHWASDCTLHEAHIFYNFTNYHFRCKW